MKAEIIYDLPEAEYHASSGLDDGQYVTRSIVKTMEEGVRGVYERYIVKNPYAQVKPSKYLDFGSLLECIITGQKWEDFYYIGCLKREDEIAFEENKKKKADGLIEITREQLEKALLCIDGMKYDERGLVILGLMEQAKHSVTVRYECPVSGLPSQVRLDTLIPDIAILDYKTTSKHPSKFSDSAYEYGYSLQQIMYTNAWYQATGEELPFYFPVFQSQFPFAFDFIELAQPLLDDAKYFYEQNIMELKKLK